MIRVVAVITTNPGRREELLAAFRANVPNVHAEKGCIEYAGHIDAATVGPFQADYGPDSLVVLESWESPEALRGSRRGPSHEGLLRKDQGSGGEADNPRPVRDRLDSHGLSWVRRSSPTRRWLPPATALGSNAGPSALGRVWRDAPLGA
jgi:quinol monooxygenase YgiN